MHRQGPPGWFEPCGLSRLVDLQRFDGQFELLEARAELLGRGGEARPLQPGELSAQLLDQGASALTHSDGAALPMTALRMAAAGLVQTKGFGLSLCSAM